MILLATLLAVSYASAQTTPFVSPDGTFQFDYPQSLTACEPQQSTSTIVCLAYPSDRYRGYNFTSGNFSVSTPSAANTQRKCLRKLADNCQPRPSELHGGITFAASICGEAGLGHYVETYVYRTFHRGMCYQLSLEIATTAFENYEPGAVKRFSDADREAVKQTLSTPLNTFAFRK